MEDFRIIYRILKFLQQSMDFEDFDSEGFNAERFCTNPNRFQALLIQLQRAGYIEGLEYLQENSMMKQAAAFAKGIKEIVPGI